MQSILFFFFKKKKEQAKISILCVIRAVVTKATNLFLVERILNESKYFELYH